MIEEFMERLGWVRKRPPRPDYVEVTISWLGSGGQVLVRHHPMANFAEEDTLTFDVLPKINVEVENTGGTTICPATMEAFFHLADLARDDIKQIQIEFRRAK